MSLIVNDKCLWKLGDLIDYELFLDEFAQVGDENIPQLSELRGRLTDGMDESTARARKEDTTENRRWWLRQWTETRRGNSKSEDGSAGQLVESALSTATFICGLVGGLTGCSIISTLISVGLANKLPDGSPVPINVPFVLAVCVLPQLALLFLAGWGMIAYSAGWRVRIPLILRFLNGAILSPMFVKIAQGIAHTMSDRSTAKLRSAVGLIMGRSKIHRRAFILPIVICFQWLATACSIGIAVGLLAMLQVRHIPFGWQTSNFNWSVSTVASLVKISATPWSWMFGSEGGYPSEGQVRETEILINQGSGDLKQDALVAWGPYVVLFLISYVCLPRLALLLYSRNCYQRALRAEPFLDARSDKLFRKLTVPVIEFSPNSTQDPSLSLETIPSTTRPAPKTDDQKIIPARGSLVVISPELYSPGLEHSISQVLVQQLGWQVAKFHPVYKPSEQTQLVRELQELVWVDKTPRVLFVKRAGDPITKNIKLFVQDIINAIGSSGHLTLGIGARGDFVNGQVAQEEKEIWIEFANELKLRSPNVEVLVLADKSR